MSETTTRRSTKGKSEEKPQSTVEVETYADEVDELAKLLPGIPERPGAKMVTFADLQQRLGKKPKKNRLFGKYEMSGRYKEIGAQLEAVRKQMHDLSVADVQEDRDGVEATLIEALRKVDVAAANYRKKHTGKKGNAVKGVQDDIDRFRQEIPTYLDNLLKNGGQMPPELGLDQAMIAQRLGIRPDQLEGISAKHCRFDLISDENQTKPPKVLGKGACNTVDLVENDGVARVFKPEQKKDPNPPPASWGIGIDPANPRYGNRNVASSIIGKLLGSKVMPEAAFGISKGEIGLVMETAPGKTPAQKVEGRRDPVMVKPWDTPLSPKAKASLQKQLAELEATDILTGQTDRHAGNYMIDVQGDEVKVTGIDNDFCLGGAKKEKDGVPPFVYGMTSVKNMPVLLGRETANAILDIDVGKLKQDMEGLLAEAEIEGLVMRVGKLQAHVTALGTSGHIVDDWETWTDKDGKTAQQVLGASKDQSIFKRDMNRFIKEDEE